MKRKTSQATSLFSVSRVLVLSLGEGLGAQPEDGKEVAVGAPVRTPRVLWCWLLNVSGFLPVTS